LDGSDRDAKRPRNLCKTREPRHDRMRIAHFGGDRNRAP
jgi:hypothetical protein